MRFQLLGEAHREYGAAGARAVIVFAFSRDAAVVRRRVPTSTTNQLTWWRLVPAL